MGGLISPRKTRTSLLDALTTLVDFAREFGGEERGEVRRAMRKAEQRVAQLRTWHERRRHSSCARCGASCSTALCWRCLPHVPYQLRILVQNAIADESRALAQREVEEWLGKHEGRGL